MTKIENTKTKKKIPKEIFKELINKYKNNNIKGHNVQYVNNYYLWHCKVAIPTSSFKVFRQRDKQINN